ncbi:MAG: D-alanine--D-alanine ligase [Sandaracinaceae bacterium]|nr:D-alanine--D-alanine ligase [Sandaracinaceae bacterium]
MRQRYQSEANWILPGSKRIGVLMGGLGPEREVSLASGQAVLKALKNRGHEVVGIDVGSDLPEVLEREGIEVAFLVLHGPYGEDGCIQGLLELKGIPYTGSGVLASALAMDKLKAKELFRLYNIPTPPYYVLEEGELERLEEVHGSFGFPVFVKPRRGGSSIGAGKASDWKELRERCEEALMHDCAVLVERFIRGREITVAVLDGRALGALEIVPRAAFYDRTCKYEAGRSEYHMPARLTPARYKGVLLLAERAHKALGCIGFTRVDLIVTEGENEYVLEVNTIPGMTPTSLLPKIAESAGYSFEALCEEILARASLGNRLEPRKRHFDVASGHSFELFAAE